MRRRFSALLLLVFFGVFLMGCDWFGPQTTFTIPTTTAAITTTEAPTTGELTTGEPTTAAPTTAAPTTAAPTTAAPTTAAPTTASPTTAAPTTAAPTTAAPTTAAPTTAAPTTAAPTTAAPTTAVPTTAAPTTAAPTTTVPTTVETTTAVPTTTIPVTTAYPTTEYSTIPAPDTVSVVFYNYDGTELYTTQIAYGGTAVYGGIAPVKADDDDYTYTFAGWSGPLDELGHDTSFVAQFEAAYKNGTLEFDPESLYDVIRGMNQDPEYEPSPEEIEEKVGMMMQIFGIFDEEHLYNELQVLLPLIGQISEVDTLTEFNDWYLSLKAAGIDQEFFVNVVIRMLSMSVSGAVYVNDPGWMITDLNGYINQFNIHQSERNDLLARLGNYCNYHTYVGIDAMNYFNARVEERNLANAFFQAMSEAERQDEYFHDGPFYDLRYYRSMYYQFLYEYQNPVQAAVYNQYYQNTMNSCEEPMRTLYQQVMDAYDSYMIYRYESVPVFRETLGSSMDYDTPNSPSEVRSVIDGFYNDYCSMTEEMESLTDHIFQLYDEIPKANRQYEFLLNVESYLLSAEGQLELKEALIAVYEMMDAMMINMDPDLFNMVIDLMMAMQETEEEPTVFMVEPKPQFDFLETLLETYTTDEIAGFVQDLAGMLTIAETVMDQENIAEITDVIKDVLEMYLVSENIPEVAIPGLLSKVDEYMGHVSFVFSEVIDLLEAADGVKVQKVIDFAMMMESSYDLSQMEIIIGATGLADALLSDGVFDLIEIVNRAVGVYYDVTTQFDPDPILVGEVQVALADNLTELINLCSVLGEKEIFNLGPDGIRALEELMVRMQAIQMMFEDGIESILNPIEFGFDHDVLLDFIYDMFGHDLSEIEAEAQIVDLMTLFDLEEEVDLYYLLLAGMMQVESLRSVRSFTNLSTWVEGIYGLGFSGPEMATIAVNLIRYQLENQLAVGGTIDQRKAEFEEEIQYILDEITQIESDIADFDLFVQDTLTATYPEEDAIFLIGYWNQIKIFYEYDLLFEQLHDALDLSEEEYYLLQDLLYYAELIIRYDDPEDIEAYQTLYDTLTLDQATLFGPVIEAYSNYVGEEILFYDMDNEVSENYPEIYWDIDEWQWQYRDLLNSILYYQYDIAEQEMAYENLLREEAQLIAWSTYLTDPTKVILVEDVLVIALEEIDNLLISVDPVIMDEIFAEIFARLYYGYYGIDDEVSETDLTPEKLESYLGEIAVLLDSIFGTMDEVDDAKVTTLLKDILAIQLESAGIIDPDLTAMIAKYGDAIDQYFPEIETVLGLLAVAIDGIDVVEIETIITAIKTLSDEDSNSVSKIIQIARIITILSDNGELDPLEAGTLDWEYLMNLALEITFDVHYEFEDYDPALLTDALNNIGSHATDMLEDLAIIAGFDEFALTFEDMAFIHAYMEYGEYFVYQLMEVGPEGIEYPFMDGEEVMVFGYDHQDFVNKILDRFGEDLSETEVDDFINGLMDIYEASTEEDAFYLWNLTDRLFCGARYIDSFMELLEWRDQLASIGIPEDVLLHLLIRYLPFDQMEYISDLWQFEQIEYLIDDISLYEDDITYFEGEIATYDDEMALFALDITDPDIRANVLALIEAGKVMWEAESIWQDARNNIEYPDDYAFDWYVDEYDMLRGYLFGDYLSSLDFSGSNPLEFDNYLATLDYRSYEIYGPILDMEEEFAINYIAYWTEFYRVYDLLVANESGEEWILDHLNGILSIRRDSLFMINNAQRQIIDLEDEIAELESQVEKSIAMMMFFADPTAQGLLESVLLSMNTELTTILSGIDEEDLEDYLWDMDWHINALFNYLDAPWLSRYEAAYHVNEAMTILGPLFLDYTVESSDLALLLDQFVMIYAENTCPDDMLLEDWTEEVEYVLFSFIVQLYEIDGVDPENMIESDLLLLDTFLQVTYPEFMEMFVNGNN